MMKMTSSRLSQLSVLASWSVLLFLAPTVLLAQEEDLAGDLMQFENGDELHGKLVSATGGETVTWKRQDVPAPFKVKLDNLKIIKLTPSDESTVEGVASSVYLTNGDVLQGSIVEMSDDALVLDTSYAGTLRIRRPVVQTIFPGERKTSALYSGPSGLQGWSLDRSGSWKCVNNTLVSQSYGAIGRDVKLPDRARIDFDLAWQYHYPDLRFAFYSNNPKSYSDNSFLIRASSSYLRFYRYQHGSSSSYTTASYPFQMKRKAHFTILANKMSQTVTVQVDGQTLKQWTDIRSTDGLGSSIIFHAQSGRPLSIRNIEVTAWDGVVPGKNPGPSDEDLEEDYLNLVNGDKLSGMTQTIKDGTLSFKTSYASFPIPVERVSCLKVSSKNAERARRNANDVTAHLNSGAMITLDLLAIKDGKLTGKSENYSDDVSLAADSIEKLSFNIYREREEEDVW